MAKRTRDADAERAMARKTPTHRSRRVVIKDPERYKTVLCDKFRAFGECRYGRKCQFAHGDTELRSLPPAPPRPCSPPGGAVPQPASPRTGPPAKRSSSPPLPPQPPMPAWKRAALSVLASHAAQSAGHAVPLSPVPTTFGVPDITWELLLRHMDTVDGPPVTPLTPPLP